MAVLIELNDVTCFGGDESSFIDGANVKFLRGEKVLVLAPPASGKGLLIRLIAGLVRPYEGTVYVFGQDITWLDSGAINEIRQKIGFVFPECTLISNLKVIENVALPLLYHSDLAYDECMERSLKLLGSAGYRGGVWEQPGHLSPYARKAVATARALAMAPEIVVSEDLFSGLTEPQKAGLAAVTNEYHKTHNNSLLLHITYEESDIDLVRPDRVVRIEGNRLIE
jgi:ABC-type transporter Mla maintaining outer membrane lipid asymmetry ATPase subunit MlaF